MIKTIITNTFGGMPLDLDDIQWMQEGIMESFLAILSGYAPNDTNCIVLSGCVIGNGTDPGMSIPLSLTAGYIYYKGEIRRVDAVANFEGDPDTIGNTCWVADDVVDVLGSETFFDSSVQNTYQIKKAKIQGFFTIDDADHPRTNKVKTLQYFIRLDLKNSIQTTILTTEAGWTSPADIKMLVFNDGMVRFDGIVSCDSILSGQVIFIIPNTGYRPTKDTYFYLPRAITSPILQNPRGIYVKINSDGEVIFTEQYEGSAFAYGTGCKFDLTSIQYYPN